MKQEDYREWLFVFAISCVLFLIFILTPINAWSHEMGHTLTCQHLGGVPEAKKVEEGYETICKHPTWTTTQATLFFLSGIGGELLLGLFFFLIPTVSIFGSFIILNTSFNWFMGMYAFDLQQSCGLGNLCLPDYFGFLLFALGIAFFIFSILYTKWLVEDIDIPVV